MTKKTFHFKRVLALALMLCMAFSCLYLPAAAEDEEEALTLTAGELVRGFADGACASDDPSVAWVDAEGTLRALREGQTTITVGEEERLVNVTAYDDGTDVAGQLKIVARFNDSMQFFDGHVYLIFTSYKDGQTVAVDDLYAGYEISPLYYFDIRNDISNGSNHTGSDADKYFTMNEEMKSVTLDRGEVVTIGMYRDFDLSVPEAALGSLQNSTLWNELSASVKATIIEKIFALLTQQPADSETAFAEWMSALQDSGVDYRLLLDGVVGGGVCFNRELYNQKLEWDQFENATYELDITEAQLQKLNAALTGNLDRFSILKNSCATVALRAWNAAVGSRNGEDTAYKLEPTGEGIFALIDAPKTVKAEIVAKLPGYYLNKSDSTPDELEPNAGFYDETGWVYVSAPEVVALPDDGKTMLMTDVLGADANAETAFWYQSGDEKVALPVGQSVELAPGTPLFVSAKLSEEEAEYVLADVTLHGVSILDSFDEASQIYSALMPEESAALCVSYQRADLHLLPGVGSWIQIAAGDTLDISDYAELLIGGNPSDEIAWEILNQMPEEILKADETGKTVTAEAAGTAMLWAYCTRNENVGVPLLIDVIESADGTAKITYNEEENGKYTLLCEYNEDTFGIPFSGYMVPQGTKVSIELTQEEPVVVSDFRVNGKKANIADSFTVVEDTEFSVIFQKAEIGNLPGKLYLANEGDTEQLKATVRYVGMGANYLPVYDKSVRYQVSDPILSVSDDGLLTVEGEIPAEGKCVIVTAYAGSSNDKVFATMKVILGNYAGERIVGRLTVAARPITQQIPVPHAFITFTTYEDIDLNISYYRYYKPTDRYIALVEDYEKNPEKYAIDPILYQEDLDLGDRTRYFEEIEGGVGADPATVHIDAGNGITVSTYAHGSAAETLLAAFGNGQLASNGDVQVFMQQLQQYLNGEDYDGAAAFDSFADILAQTLAIMQATGQMPADGRAEGGRDVNTEVYRQFLGTGSQIPNNYYTIELTADELAVFQSELADPARNYFSAFTRNCGIGTVELWNTVTADRPELKLNGGLTGSLLDPQMIYMELRLLREKTGLEFDGTGEGGGSNRYAHIVHGFRRGELPFVDVAEGDYFYDAVAWAVFHEPQITNGTDATHFSPDATCTRAQAVTFLWRAKGCPEPTSTENPFKDVKEGAYYYKAVLWAVENGITNGVSATNFAPDSGCTRAQVVTFLCRSEHGERKLGTTNPFKDVKEGAYYYNAVLWAVDSGITNGTSDTVFSPDMTCTRAHIVTFLYRAMTRLAE